jgi:hypothetical protein
MKLKTHLLVNDMIIPLNDFTQQYIGNVMIGIAASLGSNSKNIKLSLNKDDLKIFAGDQEVPVRKEFVHKIVTSTLKGMCSPLKGIDLIENNNITINVS